MPLQARLAEWLAERRLQTSLPDGVGPGLVVSSFAAPAELRTRGVLDDQLADWLAESYVVAPSLADRPEDLRALTLDVLCRVGLRTRGEPLGLAPDALRQLLDQVFGEGLAANEFELEAMIYRAAAHANAAASGHSGVLTLEDLTAGGLRTQKGDDSGTAVAGPPRPTAPSGQASGPRRDKLAPC